MKRNAQITAALLMATMTAAACSSGEITTESTSRKPIESTAKMVPISATIDAPAPKTTGDIKPNVPTPVKGSGAATYTDGEKAYQQGNYAEAVKAFEGYTEQRPKNAWGHYMLGLSAWKSGDPAKAETAFNAALDLDPKHLKSLVNLSRVLVEQKRYEDAMLKLQRAEAIEPKTADIHRMLGRTYAAQGKTDDAIKSYRTAITLDEKDPWAMNNLGLIFLDQKRYDEALPLLAKAVELKKEPVFYNNLGMALENTKHFEAAANAYKGALAVDPGSENAQRNLKRVEGVKIKGEEPIDLEATAKRFNEQKPSQDSETPAGR